jgi:hypothetical protein
MTAVDIALPKLHRCQQEIKDGYERHNVVCAGRQFGKNVLEHDFTVDGILKGWPVGWGSPTYKNLTEDWRTLVEILKPVTRKKSEDEHRIESVTGGVIEMWSLDSADVIRGRKYHRFIINEPASVKNLLEIWNMIITPTLVALIGDSLFGGTPNGMNDFSTIYSWGLGDSKKEGWKSRHFTSYDNPYLDPNELDKLKQTMTIEQFRQEILAKFNESEGSVFRNLDAALMGTYDGVEKHKEHMLVGGVDWGKSNDFTVLAVGCADCKREVAIDRFNQIDYAFQVQRVEALNDKWKVKRWEVELNSIGGPAFEMLQRRGLPLRGFTTTHVSKQPLIESFGLALERGELMLLPDDVGRAELQAYQRKSTPTGLSTYGAPSGMNDDTVIARALMWRAMQAAPKSVRKIYEPSKYDKALAGFFNQRR